MRDAQYSMTQGEFYDSERGDHSGAGLRTATRDNCFVRVGTIEETDVRL